MVKNLKETVRKSIYYLFYLHAHFLTDIFSSFLSPTPFFFQFWVTAKTEQLENERAESKTRVTPYARKPRNKRNEAIPYEIICL